MPDFKITETTISKVADAPNEKDAKERFDDCHPDGRALSRPAAHVLAGVEQVAKTVSVEPWEDEQQEEPPADPAAIARERLECALEAGSSAFWAKIGEEFPEVLTGDFDPGATDRWETACREAVLTWLRWNLPRGTIEPNAEVIILESGATGRVVDDYHDGPTHQCMIRVDPFLGEPWVELEDLALAAVGSPMQRLWWLWHPEVA